MGLNVFLTGGSGFVGGHLIEGLVRDDGAHTVRALARSDASADVVRGFGAEPVRADLTALTAADVKGSDTFIHCAARADDWGTREEFWTANVMGTARAIAAAKAGGVKRFVFIGTEAAVFAGHDLVEVDETFPYPSEHRYLYSETKAEAEKLVLAASSADFETISIRPRLVWGPRDTSVLPAILAMAKAGRFAWLDGGRAKTSTTHVANVVHAVKLALERGTPGRAYYVTDDGVRTMRDFLGALAKTQGVDLPTKSMPSKLARPLAWLVEGVWRLFRVKSAPPMTRFAIDMLSSSVTIDTTRARTELGYAAVIDVDAGLAAMTAE